MQTVEGRLLGLNERHCLTVLRSKASRLLIRKLGQRLSRRVINVRVRVGLHLHHDDSCGKGNEVTAVINCKGALVPLQMRSAVSIVYKPAQCSTTRFTCGPIHVDEQQEAHIAFEATLLSWFPIDFR